MMSAHALTQLGPRGVSTLWQGLRWPGVVILVTFGVLLPGAISYFMMVSPFMVLNIARYAVVVLILLWGFKGVASKAPWYVRLVMSVLLGQIILNYGFTNIVIGVGVAKFTFAEAGVLLGLAILLPKTFETLRSITTFWVALAALIVPPLIHLYGDVSQYGMAAMRDVLSVVDLLYFLAGLAVCAFGVQNGCWISWRNRFVTIWIIASVLYGLTWPLSPYLLAISPSFSSYQQTIPVLGHQLTSQINIVAAVAACFAVPYLLPKWKAVRVALVALILVGTIIVVAMSQSRNLYAAMMLLPAVLAFFGYRRAFLATFLGLMLMVLALIVLEAYQIRIAGRISDVTFSAVVDRLMSVSGRHGDADGAHGVNQRLDWWKYSLGMWSDSLGSMVFGVGYGQPLTNFSAPGGDFGEGVVVREPHNSYISSLVRGGVVYFVLWASIVFSAMAKAWRGAKLPGLNETHAGGYKGFATWSFIVMLTIAVTSLSEPHFETPSIAAMFYFLAGIATVEYLVVARKIIPATRGSSDAHVV